MTACKQKIEAVKLVPSDGGRFEISCDGQEIYSKLKAGDFPDEQMIVNEILRRL